MREQHAGPSDAASPDGEPPAATARTTDRVGPKPAVLLVGGAVLVLALVVVLVLVLALASVFGRSADRRRPWSPTWRRRRKATPPP